MTIRAYYGVAGYTTGTVDNVNTVIPVTPSLLGALIASGFVSGADEAYFSLSAGNLYEMVRVVGYGATTLNVVRGVNGTVAQPWPTGTNIKWELTSEYVQQGMPVPAAVAIAGTGLATVDNPSPNTFGINVDSPNFIGAGGIEVTGAWPNITFTYVPSDDGCCGGDGGGGSGSGITVITGSGIASATVNGTSANINVPSPNFIGNGIAISGSWPNITFTVTAGGNGTVTSVGAGAGMLLTGNPNVNPTLAIANTGVVAGAYGDIAVNARGQLTAVTPGFNPISSIITPVDGGLLISRVGGEVALAVQPAAVGVRGAVELMDDTAPLDPMDDQSAVTPAGLNAALEALILTQAAGASSYTSAPDATYTNPISASVVAVQLLDATEKAVVFAEATVIDSVAPATPVPWALGVFSVTPSISKIAAKGSMSQISQSLSFIMQGPFNGNIGISTSAVPSGAVLADYSLWVIKI